MKPYIIKGRTSGMNPKDKSGARVFKTVRCYDQCRSGNSGDDVGAKLYQTLPFSWTTSVAWRRQTCCMGSRRCLRKSCPGLQIPIDSHIIQLLNFRTLLDDLAGSLHSVAMKDLHKCVFCALAFNISSGRVR